MRSAAAFGLALALLFGAGAGRADVEFECLIQPWSTVTVSAAIEGVVEEVGVDRGDLVEKGQVIAQLESNVERKSVAVARARARAKGGIRNAEARLAFAERALSRQTQLAEQSVGSESEMDAAVSAKQLAEAEVLEARETKDTAGLELERAQAALERRTIRSPINGVVVERILEPGEYADPPQILELAQIDPLRVEVFAPLELVGRVQAESEAEVIPEGPEGSVYNAKVASVDRVVDAASGTFGIRLELPNPDYALPAGLSCRVRFPLNEAPVARSDARSSLAPPGEGEK